MASLKEHIQSARRTGNIEFYIEERTGEYVTSRMPVKQGMLNPFGTVQAGAIIWLADVTATVMAIGKTEIGEQGQGFPLAVDLHTTLLGNQRDGEITAEARVVRRGKRVIVVRTRVTGNEGRVLAELPAAAAATQAPESGSRGIRIAVVGRPNVGKSTLINRMLGEQRVLAYDQPGTTRDSIYIPFRRDGEDYTLIDTAGVRRRSRVDEAIEKFSVLKTLQAISDAHVAILVLDAHSGEVAEQDATLAGHILESGTAVVIAVNKWDGLDADRRQWFRDQLERRLPFLGFAERYFISALHGSGVGDLFAAVQSANRAAQIKVSTPVLTRLLEQAVHEHQPPLARGRRIKLRYAHQGGQNPPVIVIHGNQTERLPDGYKRYLSNYFRTALQLVGTPIRLEFRTGENPYQGRRNILTPRQQRRRKRMIRHVKK